MDLLATSIVQGTPHLPRLRSLLLHCRDYVGNNYVGIVYTNSLSTAIQWNEATEHGTSTTKSPSSALSWEYEQRDC